MLRDHLGNARVTFSDGDYNGIVTAADIKQTNHYYPFGLNMEGPWNGAKGDNKYQYNGKELNDDYGLGWNDYGFRMYDPAIGRWGVIDPMAERRINVTPYAYVLNNPVRLIDLMGLTDYDPSKDPTIHTPEVVITGQRSNATGQWKGFISQWDNETFQEFRKGPASDQVRISNAKPIYDMSGVEGFPLIGYEYDDREATEDEAMDVLKDWWAQENSSFMNYSSVRAEAVSSTQEGVRVLAPVVVTAIISWVGVRVPQISAGRVVTANGIKTTGFNPHGMERALERGVSVKSIEDALRNPLKINPKVRDEFGRPSQRFFGKNAEVAINPRSGKIISVNPMGSKNLAKLLRQLAQ